MIQNESLNSLIYIKLIRQLPRITKFSRFFQINYIFKMVYWKKTFNFESIINSGCDFYISNTFVNALITVSINNVERRIEWKINVNEKLFNFTVNMPVSTGYLGRGVTPRHLISHRTVVLESLFSQLYRSSVQGLKLIRSLIEIEAIGWSRPAAIRARGIKCKINRNINLRGFRGKL